MSLFARTLRGAVPALVAGCGGSTAASDALSVAGLWQYSYSLASSLAGVSCTGGGQMTVTQQGASFTGGMNGTLVCNTAAGQVTQDGTASLTDGTISGNQVAFRLILTAATCDATGTAVGGPVSSLSGTATCSILSGPQQITASGPWQATR